jgi:prepilin-type N-terminal cleavage/methylation domain-containing protein
MTNMRAHSALEAHSPCASIMTNINPQTNYQLEEEIPVKKFIRKTDGFTLIELLVVIVIIALLMAIAIPAYLSQQKKAKDSAAKQYLNVAWKALRTGAVDSNGNYRGKATAASSELLWRSDISTSEPYLVPLAKTNASITTFGLAASGCTMLRTLTGANGAKAIVIGRSSSRQTAYLYSKSDSGRVFQLYTSDRSVANGASPTGSPLFSVINAGNNC